MAEDVEINKKDIEDIEREVLSKEKKREEEIRSNVEAKLRREMEEDKKRKEEADKFKSLEEENKTMQKMLKELEEKNQRQMEELKSQLGASKAIHNFQPNQKPKEGLNLNDDTMKEIDEESKKILNEEKFSFEDNYIKKLIE